MEFKTKMTTKEFKKLEDEGFKLREEIEDCFLNSDDKSQLWDLINTLIENEIQQEKLCNQ